MQKPKLFSKHETISLVVIFLILLAVSVPNFVLSLRRSRDQVRRDDLGALESTLGEYYKEFGVFPPSSQDGLILGCLRQGDTPYQDKKGNWIFDPIACNWGVDAFKNPISGATYMSSLPRDPDWEEGASYLYISDKDRYQLFATMEGKNEADIDQRIIERNLSCGNQICNIGRSYGCAVQKTLAECEEEAARVQK